MKTHNRHRQAFGSRRVRHVHAQNNEWVCVHRAHPTTHPTSSDWLWPLVVKIGGAILTFVIISKILTALMPFLVLGAVGWLFLATRR